MLLKSKTNHRTGIRKAEYLNTRKMGDTLPRPHRSGQLQLPLGNKGIYCVSISDSGRSWIENSRLESLARLNFRSAHDQLQSECNQSKNRSLYF